MLRRLLPLLAVLALPLPATPAGADYASTPISTARVQVPMVFPVIGGVSYSDTFLACRSGCTRKHFGQDLMGRKMQPLVAVFDGYVSSLKRERTVGEGNYVTLRGDTGWSANYIHVNNDTPGTDDGRGTGRYDFAPGLSVGDRVFAGQLLGWLGDSGNAEGTGPHLHFELRQGEAWGGTVYNAIWSLNAAGHIATSRTSGPHPVGSFVRTTARGAPTWRVTPEGKRRVAPAVLAALGFTPAQVVVVTPNEERWYPTLSPLPLPDGLAYRDPNGVLWFVTDGVRHRLPGVEALAGLGVAAARVRTADAASIAATPAAPADAELPGLLHSGATVQEGGTGRVWWIADGERRLVTDWYTLARWGRSAADLTAVPVGSFLPVLGEDEDGNEVEVSPGVPEGSPMLLPDGLQLKDGINRRWITTEGEKRVLPEYPASLYGWTPVQYGRAPGADMLRMPTGASLP